MGTLGQKKFGFIGTGNLAQAIIKALIESKTLLPSQIFASNRTEGKLKKAAEAFLIQAVPSNEELIEKSDVIILGIKPQDLTEAIEPISSSFQPHQTVISLAAGVPLSSLRKLAGSAGAIIRVMPNTAAKLKQAVVGYCSLGGNKDLDLFVEELFSPLGIVVKVDEGEAFEALSVACSAGIGFVIELMLYWQEWLEEHDFDSQTARAMTVKTFLGAAMLADESESLNLEDLQARVASKKGITAAGLNSMRELEVERVLRYSFEKAVLRDRELGKDKN